MMDWKNIKEDIAKGLREGLESVKDGAGTIAKKAEELSSEGQKKVRVFNLKRRIQDDMEELGVLLYNTDKAEPGTIVSQAAREIVEKIDRKFAELKDLEG